jgi:peptidyl-prolyl cis-trans isomerase SDCCAG10
MSNLYNLEPQPTAKVVLQTTAGDLLLELFAKQTPLASRNFLQHCLDGYYNGTIFHRLVPKFIIQGGDPTGTGSGGISGINDGEPFKDEFHSRLKFNRRGLLGMANEGKDSNGSQFFLTLEKTPELQDKHTLFGRVEGDTIYNLMKMAEAELVEGEGSERPLYPTRVTGAEVLVNPFEDLIPRVREAPRTKVEDVKKETKKRKKPAGKNVLSFGGDEGDEEVAAPVLKKTKANPKLVVAEEDEVDTANGGAVSELLKAKTPEKVRKRRSPSPIRGEEVPESPPMKTAPPKRAPERSPSTSPEREHISKKASVLERTNAEIAALKASMKRNVDIAPEKREKPKSALEALIPSNSTRGRKRGKATDEKGALDLFKAFKQRLEDLPESERPPTSDMSPPTNGHNPEPTTTEGAEDDEAELCDLHFIANCQSCKSWDDHDNLDGEAEADGEDDAAWMAHTLSFAKDTLGKDLEWKKKMEEIEVIDPREKARTIMEERRKDRDKGKGKEKVKG